MKGGNIVIDKNGDIKLIDFGSIVFDSNEYGNFGYTEYYNFFQHIKVEERNKYKEFTFLFELYSIYVMMNKIKSV